MHVAAARPQYTSLAEVSQVSCRTHVRAVVYRHRMCALTNPVLVVPCVLQTDLEREKAVLRDEAKVLQRLADDLRW